MSVKPVAKRVVVAALAVLLILAVAGRSRVRIFGGENRRSATISVAKLSSAGTPDNCADVIFSTGRTFDAERLKAMGFVVLKSTCAETFSGFVALASCSRSNSEDDTQPTARGVASYYDVATLEGDDTYYGQCLGTGGSWKIKPQSDPDYARARARMGGSAPHHEMDSLMELMR